MMRLYAWQNIFYLSLVFACGYANAGSIEKRQAENTGLSGYVDMFINAFGSVPFVGDQIVGMLQWIVQAISLFEIATNGALARLLGGALPCDIALSGLSCSGLSSNGGFATVLMNTLDGVPSIILPGFVKSLLELGIQMFVDPTVDVLFGGVTVDS